jgi:hypothetical protein
VELVTEGDGYPRQTHAIEPAGPSRYRLRHPNDGAVTGGWVLAGAGALAIMVGGGLLIGATVLSGDGGDGTPLGVAALSSLLGGFVLLGVGGGVVRINRRYGFEYLGPLTTIAPAIMPASGSIAFGLIANSW